ncbi:hypothetical protein [Dactylosporangium sp. NPDC005555]|uniref:hypothetical protein n=1 Tax=Dactylosporangium sp. NPDC005555 TaxID=3154889 RepID=UPI0033B20CB9
MRRTIAVALAIGLLFAGGCSRQDRRDRGRAAVSTPSAVAVPSSTGPVPSSAGPVPSSATGAGSGSVDELLDQVDAQLSGDAQPADDED